MADQFDRRDDIVDRAVDALRELPPLDRASVSRIVATAARARELDAEPHADDLLPPGRRYAFRLSAVAGIAAAAALVGYLVGGARTVRVSPEQTVVATAPSSSARQPTVFAAAAPSADNLPVPTQFVFDGRAAKRVVLVGDFNGWDESALPLAREDGSTLWSVTVPLMPGRHVYAFLVDSVWTVDPRAPAARDPDFGVTGSVVIVGKP